jgi:hypothetical protein
MKAFKRGLRRKTILRSRTVKLRKTSRGTRVEVDWKKMPGGEGGGVPRWQ